jgi:transposase-like protein
MNTSFCPHCRSGHDPVLKDSTWSCGVRFNDPQWRTKECYKRNLELASERIKRMKVAGDAMAHDHNPFTFMDWQRAKEAKP